MARSFDGSTDRIDYGNVWNPSTTGFTFGAWVKCSTPAGFYYFLTVNNAGGTLNSIFYFYDNAGDLELGFTQMCSGSPNLFVKGDIDNATDDGSWHHVLMTWDGTLNGTGVLIYVDGVEAPSYPTRQNGTTSLEAGTGAFNLGARQEDDNRNFPGDMAEPGMWDRVLSAGEIVALAKGFSPRFFLAGLRFAPELIGTRFNDPISGEAGTLDGTTASDHKTGIIYPASPSIVVPVAVVERGLMATQVI